MELSRAAHGLSVSRARLRWGGEERRWDHTYQFFSLSDLEVSSGAFSFANMKVAVS